jgi:hypothetical protein
VLPIASSDIGHILPPKFSIVFCDRQAHSCSLVTFNTMQSPKNNEYFIEVFPLYADTISLIENCYSVLVSSPSLGF